MKVADIAAWMVLGAVAVAVTWPLAVKGSSGLPDADDAYFSVWRLAWVAHQLREGPATLFDTNVFHPATDTLAYSDAMLLVGVLSAPLIWSGLAPVTVHNIVLIAAFATSAWAMYVLARRLTGDRAAAFLAAIVFSAAPYRIAHIGHLELEWVAWMPISLLLLHKLLDEPRLRDGILLGVTVAAQTFCSIYYGIFLTAYLLVAWCLLVPGSRQRKRAVVASALAVVPLVLILWPYSIPYGRVRDVQEPRRKDEIARYSAVPGDYLRVPPDNLVWGREESGPAPDERTLFPGAVALTLTVVALWPPVRRTALFYALIGLMSFDASLGQNGLLFRALQEFIPPLASLRSPARFGILVLLSVSRTRGAWRSTMDPCNRRQGITVDTRRRRVVLRRVLVRPGSDERGDDGSVARSRVAGCAAHGHGRRRTAAAEVERAVVARDDVSIQVHIPLEAARERLQRLRTCDLPENDREHDRVSGRAIGGAAAGAFGRLRAGEPRVLQAGGLREAGGVHDQFPGLRRPRRISRQREGGPRLSLEALTG